MKRRRAIEESMIHVTGETRKRVIGEIETHVTLILAEPVAMLACL
jgi:hypothetical protein